jgi:hypothetical protein
MSVVRALLMVSGLIVLGRFPMVVSRVGVML